MTRRTKPSRRTTLAGLLAAPLAALGAVALLPRHAWAKLAKAEVEYQTEPNGIQRCAACIHYRPLEGTCELVEGEISPEGWCVRYNTQGEEEEN